MESEKKAIRIRRRLATPEYRVVGKCPACGNEIIDFHQSYLCKKFPDCCNFKIRENKLNPLGKNKITLEEMTSLLEGKIIPLPGLVNKKGETFDTGGRLKYDHKWGWSVQFVDVPQKNERPKPRTIQKRLKIARKIKSD